MTYIEKCVHDGTELLPDITETPLWSARDIDTASLHTPTERRLALLYECVAERENYYQINSPTAFGNPDYERLCGIVAGILAALDINERTENNRIVFRRGNKMVLAVDKLKKPDSYYAELTEIRHTRKNLGF